jgi:hypothetical protein
METREAYARKTSQPEPDSPRKQHSKERRLQIFTGRWGIEGINSLHAPAAPGAAILGEEIYEWLPGEYFLTHHWVRRMGEQSHKGVGVLGYDAGQNSYFSHTYDNLGFARQYLLEVTADTWTLTGDSERARIVFSIDGRSMEVNWEFTEDKKNWIPQSEWKATKLGQMSAIC